MAIRTTGKTSSNGRGSGADNVDRRHRDTLKLLIVVDASDDSTRMLQYIGHVLARRARVEFHLAYIAPHMPAQFLESGGAELPEREQEIESDLRAQQVRWMVSHDAEPNRILRSARARLLRAGVPAARIHACVSSPLDARTVADEVLVLAGDQKCETVVVGHRAHTWFSGLGRGHLAEQLVRSARGYAVWVVD